MFRMLGVGVRMSAGRFALLIGLLAVGGLRSWTQTAPTAAVAANGQRTGGVITLHATARLVMLDVVVTDGHGRPKAGLQAADFRLLEDGVPQTILGVTEYDAAVAQPLTEEAELPPNTFTVKPPVMGKGALTAIVLSADVDHAPFVRAQLLKFIETSSLATPIAIFRLDWQGMHLVQGFTADRRVLLEAARSERILPPLGFRVRYSYAVGTPTQHLAAYLSGIRGRVNLVWLGEMSLPSLQDHDLFPSEDKALMPGVTDIDPFDGETRALQPDIEAFLRDVGGEAGLHRLSQIALYPMDAGGIAAPLPCFDRGCVENVAVTRGLGMANGCAVVLEIGAAAGGKGFCNTSNFKDSLEEVMLTGSRYYTVSYRPSNPHWDGGYRRLKVSVTPEDTAIHQFGIATAEKFETEYRDGYLAQDAPALAPRRPGSGTMANVGPVRKVLSVSPKGDPGAHDDHMQAAMTFASLTSFQVHFTVVVTPATEKVKGGGDLTQGNYLTAAFRDGPSREYRVHTWIDPADLHLAPTAVGMYRDDLKVVAVMYRDDGLVANSVATTMHLNLTEADLETVQAQGVSVDETLAMPTAGNFFLRVGVHELPADRIGALEVPAEWIKPVDEAVR